MPAHLDGLFARMLAFIVLHGREVPNVGIRNLRSHLERPPEVFIVCSEVFIVCSEVFIVCSEVFIVCSEVFINVWFWDGFESGPGRFVKLLIRRN